MCVSIKHSSGDPESSAEACGDGAIAQQPPGEGGTSSVTLEGGVDTGWVIKTPVSMGSTSGAHKELTGGLDLMFLRASGAIFPGISPT